MYTMDTEPSYTGAAPVTYCPHGPCDSPAGQTEGPTAGCPAYLNGGGCGVFDPLSNQYEPTPLGMLHLEDCPDTGGYVQFPTQCMQVRGLHSFTFQLNLSRF